MLSAKRKPGRPRAFDTEQTLDAAMRVFWRRGYAETSLDDLTAAMGINRPSLYAAFGDKKTLYLRALRRFYDQMNDRVEHLFAQAVTIRAGFQAFFEGAIALYTAGSDGPKGCMLICTATSPSPIDDDIAAALGNSLATIDRAMRRALQGAQTRGELLPTADIGQLSMVLGATLHSLSVRARAKTPAAELQALADATLGLVFGKEVATSAS